MKRYGLIGKNLTHTFSPDYFKNKFEAENITGASYSVFDLYEIDDVQALLENGLDGFNVTIPYKESIIGYLDNLDETAFSIGAVNCVKKTSLGYRGYNTDAYGFKVSLENTIDTQTIDQAIVLGNGGAAKAIKFVLGQLNIPFIVVSRNSAMSYDLITEEIIDSHHLIVNTTPLGMYPDIDSCPEIPFQYLGNQHLLFDLVYNPEKTKFLKLGEERGAMIKNGFEMLTLQAENSWQIWNQI